MRDVLLDSARLVFAPAFIVLGYIGESQSRTEFLWLSLLCASSSRPQQTLDYAFTC